MATVKPGTLTVSVDGEPLKYALEKLSKALKCRYLSTPVRFHPSASFWMGLDMARGDSAVGFFDYKTSATRVTRVKNAKRKQGRLTREARRRH